jgi:hypothetical protein
LIPGFDDNYFQVNHGHRNLNFPFLFKKITIFCLAGKTSFLLLDTTFIFKPGVLIDAISFFVEKYVLVLRQLVAAVIRSIYIATVSLFRDNVHFLPIKTKVMI